MQFHENWSIFAENVTIFWHKHRITFHNRGPVRTIQNTFTGDWSLVTLVDATAIGTVVAESGELKLLEGTRNVFPFGTANGPHIFFGRVKYFSGFLPCSSSLECDDNNEGTGDFCVNSKCKNIPILGMCGEYRFAVFISNICVCI